MSERRSTIGLGMIVKEITADTWTALWPLLGGQIDQLVIVTTQTPSEQPQNAEPAVDARVTHGVKIQVEHFPWVDDFAAARNYAFSFLDTDWLFWIDDDDMVRHPEKLRAVVREAEQKDIGCVHLVYEYRHDDEGHPSVTQTRERLMRRDLNWTWKDRIHEYCAAEKPHVVGQADDVVIVHQSNTPNTERNLRLLHLMEQEDPKNPRMLAALGASYQSTGEWDKALRYLKAAFDVVENLDIKWTSATEMARIHLHQKEYDEATQWCHVAIDIHPEYSLSYLFLASIAWFHHVDSDRCLLWLGTADQEDMLEAPLHVQRQMADYTINRWDVEHRAYADKRDWESAYRVIKMALEYMGALDFEKKAIFGRWYYWAWYYMERLNAEKSIRGTLALVDHLFRRGDTLRARRLMEECLPLSIREDERIVSLYSRVKELTAHVFDDEAYQAFYDANHSDPHDADHVMNGVDYEPYRMNLLLERLKARGAKRILDIGCGAGEPDIWLAQQGLYVTGLDINNLSIQEARKRAKRDKAIKNRTEFRQGSLETMGPEDLGKFDAVVMMELIEHLHPSKVPFYLSSAEDFLNPGGAVFFTTPGMAVGDIPGVWEEFPRDHVQEFSRQELERLILESPSRRQKLPISLFKVYDPAVSVPGFASWFGEYEAYPEEHPISENWDKPVVIYTGPGLEEWTPRDPDEKGLGGSETWAAKTAREFRKKGHPVVVFGMTTGVYEGVIYRHYSLFNHAQPFLGSPAWLVIVSRQLAVLDARPNAQHVWFMAHDVDYGEELTGDRMANIDRYLVLSEWQKEHTVNVYTNRDGTILEPMPFEWQAKLAVISNGIEPVNFEVNAGERKPHSFIWSSSPDRGLDLVLAQWAEIRDLWPDATLDIYYGWENVDALMSSRPWLPFFKRRIIELAKQEGVTWHGRIGQRELAQEFLKHQYWYYPSRLPAELGAGEWHETFCITALEAQMGGCIPLMANWGALPERFYYGMMLNEDEIHDPATTLDIMEKYPPRPVFIEAAQKVISTDYNWTAVTEKLRALAVEPEVVDAAS